MDKNRQMYEACKATFESWPEWKQEAAREFMERYKDKPEPKRAVWDAYYVCSNCGETSKTAQAECPFCKALMKLNEPLFDYGGGL